MNQLQSLPEREAEILLEQIRKSDLYHCDRAFQPLQVFNWVANQLQWLPLLALVCSMLLLRVGVKRWETAVVMTTIAFHIFLSNLGGDADRRHLVPVEPLMWAIFIAGGSAAFRHIRQRNPSDKQG